MDIRGDLLNSKLCLFEMYSISANVTFLIAKRKTFVFYWLLVVTVYVVLLQTYYFL